MAIVKPNMCVVGPEVWFAIPPTPSHGGYSTHPVHLTEKLSEKCSFKFLQSSI